MKKSTIRHMQRLLLLSTALLAVAPVAATAQSAAAAPGETTLPTNTPADAATPPVHDQDIVVTGSRIKGQPPVGSPMIGVTRQDLVQSGAINTTQLVQDLPQVTNQGVSENSRSTSGGAGNITYASGFNIHGIGPYATLTLFNGHRLVQSGASGGLPDANDIPTIAIQRVDVVADGASAIYGSDAVAGVVNLITRRRFSGLETQAHDGIANDYHEYNLGVIAGHNWSSGNITVAYEHAGHSNLSGSTRDFYRGNLTASGGGDFRTNQCNPGNVIIGGVSYALPGLAAGTTNKCDNLKTADLIPSQQRDTAMLSLTEDFSNRLTVNFDGLYSKRRFVFTPGQLAATLNVPSSNAFYTLPAGVAAKSETVAYSFAGQQPVNTSRGGSEMYQLNGGVTWKPFGDWQVDGDVSYGHDFSSSTTLHGIDSPALTRALASSSTATALNPYGGANSRAVLDSIFDQQFYAPGTNKELQGSVTATGSLFKLPGGNVRLAVGGEIIHDSILTGTDSGPASAIISTRVYAARTTKSAYAELLVPVFGPDNAIPGFYRLDLSLAGRISHYSDVGTSRNPKVGVNWEPLRGLLLHGSYGTSFRAPNLTQLHGASSALYVQNYQSPTGVVQGVTLSGYKTGNPLTPENARTFSLGADVNLPEVPNLKVSMNYFNVKYTGQINGILANLTLLQSPATQAQYAARIVQGPQAATIVQQFVSAGYQVMGVLPANPTLFVYGNNVNSGITRTQGIDFQVSYRLGEVSLGTNGTVFTQYKTAVSPTAPLLNELNAIFYPPAFRSRSSLHWAHEGLDAALFLNYTGAYNNNQVSPVQRVGAYATVDMHLAYTLKNVEFPLVSAVTLALDMTNMLDRNPPFVNIAESPNGGGGFDPTSTNPIGRTASLTLSTKF